MLEEIHISEAFELIVDVAPREPDVLDLPTLLEELPQLVASAVVRNVLDKNGLRAFCDLLHSLFGVNLLSFASPCWLNPQISPFQNCLVEAECLFGIFLSFVLDYAVTYQPSRVLILRDYQFFDFSYFSEVLFNLLIIEISRQPRNKNSAELTFVFFFHYYFFYVD